MMTSSSSLLLHLHLLPPPPPPSLLFLNKLQTPSSINSISFHINKPRNFSISSSSSSNSPSNWEREEIRWLREEQRWEREEKRWVREESRWNSERESLLQEIAILKTKIQSLEQQQQGLVPDTISNISNLLHVLKEVDLNQNRISEKGSGPIPMMLESEKEEEDIKEMVVKEVKALENVSNKEVEKVKKWKPIKKGSEGEEVHAMQEALLKWGFYSGEEDTEFSIFSSGTERAIKTWQASIGVPEDGNMTAELLEKLFMGQETVDGTSVSPLEKENTNGASVASVTEGSKEKKSVASEHSYGEYAASHQGVFLLGENRWEDSSRLTGRDKPFAEGVVGISTTKCVSCRGEGRLLCTECDGTGEPNIEEQFMEWVDEGAKCPYCEGLGYNICDVCEGKTVLIA